MHGGGVGASPGAEEGRRFAGGLTSWATCQGTRRAPRGGRADDASLGFRSCEDASGFADGLHEVAEIQFPTVTEDIRSP